MSFKCSRLFVCLQMQNQLLLRWLTLKHGRKSKATFTKIVLSVQKLWNFRESDCVHDRLAPENGAFLVPMLFKITWNWSWLRPRLIGDGKRCVFLFQISSKLREIDRDFVQDRLAAKNGAYFCSKSLQNYVKLIITSSTTGPTRIVGKKFVKFRPFWRRKTVRFGIHGVQNLTRTRTMSSTCFWNLELSLAKRQLSRFCLSI